MLIEELLGPETGSNKQLINGKSSVILSKNPVHHDQMKHMDSRYHFIWNCVEENKVFLDYPRTEAYLADVFIRALGIS